MSTNIRSRNKSKKNTFKDIKDKFSSKEKYKALEYFDVGKAFQEAVGIPGPAKGHINMFLGHSDTSKTTALIKAAADAQKKGVLPVLIITEEKFSFEYAKLLGFDCEEVVDEETGEVTWDGFFIDRYGFDYIEQAFDYITELLDAQKKGDLPYDLLFLWDSVGTLPCKMSVEGKGGTQHTARVIAEKWSGGLAKRITSSRKESSMYTNSIIFINQAWVELPDNPFGQPKIQPKGGNSIYYSASLVFLFGNEKNSGVNNITAQCKGRKVKFAVRTKVSVKKNHINGLGYMDGKLLATPTGYIADDSKAQNEYAKENRDLWAKHFDGDFNISELEFEDDNINTEIILPTKDEE